MIHIKFAEGDKKRDAAYRMGYRVFIEQEKHTGLAHKKTCYINRLFDYYDVLTDSNKLIIATDGCNIVGCMRLSTNSVLGFPAEKYYHFRKHLTEDEYLSTTCASRFFIDSSYRGSKNIAKAMCTFGLHWAVSINSNNMIASVNPAIEKFLRRIGFKRLSEPFDQYEEKITVCPLMLDLELDNAILNPFRSALKKANFFDTYEYFYCEEGDRIYSAGDMRDYMYIVADGRVKLCKELSSSDASYAKAGETFSAMALINPGSLHQHYALAEEKTILVGLSHNRFFNILHNNTDLGLNILHQLGAHIEASNVEETSTKIKL